MNLPKNKLAKYTIFIFLFTSLVALRVFGFEIGFKKTFSNPNSAVAASQQQASNYYEKIKNKKSYEHLIYDKELVLDAFKKMAFGSEFEFKDRKRDKIAKWEEPITFYIQGEQAKKYRVIVEEHAEELAEITGHPINFWKGKGNTNVLVVLTHDFDHAIYKQYYKATKKLFKGVNLDFFKEYEKMKKQQPTMWAFGKSLSKYDSAELIFAIIFINITLKSRSIESVIIEEMTQMLGVPNDPEKLDYTLFNDRGNNETLTEVDKLVLKILYHDKIKEGMTIQDVEKVFDEVYEDVMRNRDKETEYE